MIIDFYVKLFFRFVYFKKLIERKISYNWAKKALAYDKDLLLYVLFDSYIASSYI